MSSSVHARCRTISRDSILAAAEKLGIQVNVNEEANTITFKGTVFKFDENGNADVRYYKDHTQEAKATKQLTQLGTYFTTMKRLQQAGLVCKSSVADVVLAVKANQKLKMEFVEQEQQTVSVAS